MNKIQNIIILLLGALFTHIASAKCIHDSLNHTYQHIPVKHDYPEFDNSKGRNLREYNYTNIRIVADFTALAGEDELIDELIENNLIPNAINYWTETLALVRVNEVLKIPTEVVNCIDVYIPETYQLDGVEADLIILVESKEQSGEFIASGQACYLASDTNRPVMGKISFNSFYMSTEEDDYESQLDATLHEFTHILGFSNSLFEYYIDPVNLIKLGYENVVNVVTRNYVDVYTFVVEPVRTLARDYFHCDTLEGLDIENQDEEDSIAGSHWERQVIFNELMTPTIQLDARLSDFTLALLEATGWYIPNYNMSEPISWGKSRGCDFITTTCIDTDTGVPRWPEFCSDADYNGCYWGHEYKGRCGITTKGLDYSEYNYWHNFTASSDDFSNNCPYWDTFETPISCKDTTQTSSTYFDEVFGMNSRCFVNTLADESSFGSAQAQYDSGCFEYECKWVNSRPTYELHIAIGAENIICTDYGSEEAVFGYYGVLVCPNATEFCMIQNTEFCELGCAGRGTCYHGTCVCIDGWGGESCTEYEIEYNCTRCSSSSETVENDCYGDTCICADVGCEDSALLIKQNLIFILIAMLIVLWY